MGGIETEDPELNQGYFSFWKKSPNSFQTKFEEGDASSSKNFSKQKILLP